MTSIAEQNDLFRQRILSNPDQWSADECILGKAVTTRDVALLPDDGLRTACDRVRDFSDFTSANDPYGEHDFGALQVADARLFWKIGYYDEHHECGVEDPSDLTGTRRVLTIMLADEY